MKINQTQFCPEISGKLERNRGVIPYITWLGWLHCQFLVCVDSTLPNVSLPPFISRAHIMPSMPQVCLILLSYDILIGLAKPCIHGIPCQILLLFGFFCSSIESSLQKSISFIHVFIYYIQKCDLNRNRKSL
jgi:hypothetical protein